MQVTSLIAEMEAGQRSFVAQGARNVGEQVTADLDLDLGGGIAAGHFDKVAAWCAKIARMSDLDPKLRNQLRLSFELTNKSIASFDERLSALELSGKDLADFPTSAIGAYISARQAIARVRIAGASVAEAFKGDTPTQFEAHFMQNAWHTALATGEALRAFRTAMIKPAGMRRAAADELLEAQLRESVKFFETSVSRSASLDIAKQATLTAEQDASKG